MSIKIIHASQAGARLDSNVTTGGGSDDTVALQRVLDRAQTDGGVHLVMDGAALITGLQVHSTRRLNVSTRNAASIRPTIPTVRC